MVSADRSIEDSRKTEAGFHASPPRLLVSSRLWVLAAAVLFLLQTLPYLSHRWVTDESWYAAPAYSIAHGHGIQDPAIGPNDLEHRFDARPPGTALVIATAFRLFGTSAVAARLGSVLAGLLIVVLTFLLARDVLGKEAAVVAMLLVTTDNLIVLTSRTARPEALTTLCVLLSLLAIQQYASRGLLRWPLGSGLLLALGTMFHITLLGYICSIGLLVIVLDWRARRFVLRGTLPFIAGYALGMMPFALWILNAPLGRAGFREEYLSRAVHASLKSKFLAEGHRYADILGFGMLHGHGLEQVPVRIAVPLLFCVASGLLWFYRRRWFWLELLLLLPSLLWLVYTVNKSSRYIALIAPIFALTIGAAVAAVQQKRLLHRVMLGFATIVILAQLGANVLLLKAARTANYTRIGDELRSVIPAGEPVYGTITFWLAFDDHPYISYERTEPEMAADRFHTRYFILGDRMMTSGGGMDEAFYAALNRQLQSVISDGTLVGEFVDPYYGDLRVYRLPAR